MDLKRAAGVIEPELASIPRELIHQAGGHAFGSEKLYFGDYFDLQGDHSDHH